MDTQLCVYLGTVCICTEMGTVDVVYICGGWACSLGPLCLMLVADVFILGCCSFVYSLKPVGVVRLCGGLVCPGYGALYGALCAVWVLRYKHAWVQVVHVRGGCTY